MEPAVLETKRRQLRATCAQLDMARESLDEARNDLSTAQTELRKATQEHVLFTTHEQTAHLQVQALERSIESLRGFVDMMMSSLAQHSDDEHQAMVQQSIDAAAETARRQQEEVNELRESLSDVGQRCGLTDGISRLGNIVASLTEKIPHFERLVAQRSAGTGVIERLKASQEAELDALLRTT